MKILVGYTGFVGSNIYVKGKFDAVYDSKNIKESYNTNPELLVYSGLPAEKYLANNFPEKDMELIHQAQKNISSINPKKIVLISTIDVFKSPINVNETTKIDTKDLHAYGYNRYKLECWVRENFSNALIIRLPALFGINLKKNFIYDFINLIPFMLTNKKMAELQLRDNNLKKYYELGNNNFYKLKTLNNDEKKELKDKFKTLGFNALNFTDSRSIYQFYCLNRLWDDIQIALKNDIKLWHPATEPISVSELYKYITNTEFKNELSGIPSHYNYKTIYDKIFNGSNGYICSKKEILEEIKNFVAEMTQGD